MRSPLDLALGYAEQGLRVFPCLERDGAQPKKKHGAPYYNQMLGLEHGFQDATTDPDKIRSWWNLWPGALVGLPMGAGRLVLDIDAKGEVDGWQTLEQNGWPIPADAPRVRTASGGAHVVFEAPPFPVTISAGEIGEGLDIRCEGGYVIAAGSVREDGEYQWVVGESYLMPGRLPTWLLTRLMELAAAKQRKPSTGEGRPSSSWGRATLERECETVRSAPKGSRNHALNRAAFKVGQAVGGGSLDEDLARGALYQAAIDAGLDEGESLKTIASGLGKGMREPRYPGERENGRAYESFADPDPEPEPPQGDRAPPQGEPVEGKPLVPLGTIQASSWHGQPRPQMEFLDERDLIPYRAVSIVSGTGGVGKTLLLLQAGIAAATNTLWLGGEIRAGPVLFFSAEEPVRIMHMRVDQICEAESIELDRLADFHLVDLSQELHAGLLRHDTKTGLMVETELMKRLRLTIAKVKPVLTVLDNRGLVIVGSEIDRGVASQSMRILQLLAEQSDQAIVLLAHPSARGITEETGESGSTAWYAGGRASLFLSRPKADNSEEEDSESDTRRLASKKANYAKAGVEVTLRWEYYRFICLDPPKQSRDDEIGAADKARRVFKKLLTWRLANHMRTSASPHSANYAPKVFDRAPKAEREGVGYKAFERALRELLNEGEVVNVPYGKPSAKTATLEFPENAT